MSKFGYTQGQTLLSKVRALNYRGYGDFSTPNAFAAVIKTIPTFMNIVQISLLKSDQFSLFWEGIATN
jgi:hypothetical protein